MWDSSGSDPGFCSIVVIVPIIDRTFPITEADEAMAYLERNESQGKVLLEVSGAL